MSVPRLAIDLFAERFGDAFKRDQPLAKYTSARVGGKAEMVLTVKSADDLLAAVEMAHTNGIPFRIIGGGSNVLIADAGMRGLVILNRAKKVSFRNRGFSVMVSAEAGTNISSLSRQCISNGLGGLEWAIGVPGTVGGAVVNNAGAHGSSMSDCLVTADIWVPGEGVRLFHNDELAYEYRNSLLKHEQEMVVISADLTLKPESATVLNARAQAFQTHRKETQPSGATLGSIFKNPENYYAGYLIEAAGLKGYRIGGVEVSKKHANWFVSDESATAEDVRALLAEVWHAVFATFGIKLEPEIELVGDWHFEMETQTQAGDEQS
jgi:UDP-N-acetylmuramate dehydrogenase